MRNAFVQSVFDITAVIFGLVFIVALASSIPLAVIIMYLAIH